MWKALSDLTVGIFKLTFWLSPVFLQSQIAESLIKKFWLQRHLKLRSLEIKFEFQYLFGQVLSLLLTACLFPCQLWPPPHSVLVQSQSIPYLFSIPIQGVGRLFPQTQNKIWSLVLNVVVRLLSCVWLFVTRWTAACQVSLPFTISWNLLKVMSIESVVPSNHLILCCPLLLFLSVSPSTRVFSSELALCIRWPENWSFSSSIRLSNEYSEFIFL